MRQTQRQEGTKLDEVQQRTSQKQFLYFQSKILDYFVLIWKSTHTMCVDKWIYGKLFCVYIQMFQWNF